ncbi:hypothetical protein [Halorhabdus rudnickae]|uniref:hypothetical protein n=1 Tax=Halorhabdus rudnickae TaxID=1775544 RepID=UPI0010843C54|nr:hypothetical protein [Halorhabdus rudnickae]
MTHITHTRHSIASIGAVVGGLLIIAWGILSILSYPGYATTFRPLDTVLIALSDYLWIPAVGLCILSVGVAPLIRRRVTHNSVWTVGVTVCGVILLCFGGFLTLISVNSVAGLLYLSPLFLSGVVLVVAGLYHRVQDWT